MEKYTCIHGHFYQPPRENPWLESIEVQDSAYPYHDWNERITFESYAPNSAARILNGNNRIRRIVNNYASISFNFGPTLLAWMEHAAPDIYESIVNSDRESRERFSGHGSALAQAFNHLIMPLANSRDKRTQVIWGIKDFEHRFARKPEGMWLPETAVDVETLDLMAEHGIAYTILAPHQAKRARKIGTSEWLDVTGQKVDPSTPYKVTLPSGRTIVVFFYDGVISRAVAFEGLLSSGEKFAQRIMDGFADDRKHTQLVHIATDGETYGHHHKHGEMALASTLSLIEADTPARVTNYGEFLEKFPPFREAEIYEDTSWSCVHGVERWRSDCGCNSGGKPGWNQAWRVPLREALDWLRDNVSPRFEQRAAEFLKDPWAARNDYVAVILDRSDESIRTFLKNHAVRELNADEVTTVLRLMELQRHSMLMYTSCGWFFDEISGIETVQVIQYAGRVIQLAQELFENGIEKGFLERLAGAKSNIPDIGDASRIYEQWVKATEIDLQTVAGHYAVSSLFERYNEQTRIGGYLIDRMSYEQREAGRASLAVGKARVTSTITRTTGVFSFGILHFGDHTIIAGVRPHINDDLYQTMRKDVLEAFTIADLPVVVRVFDKHFQQATYSLRSLFRDEQRKVLDSVLESNLSEAESNFRHVYDLNYSLLRFMGTLGRPLPRAFQSAAEVILNADISKALNADTLGSRPEAVTELLKDAEAFNVQLDRDGLGYQAERCIDDMIDALRTSPGNIDKLRALHSAVSVVVKSPLDADLWGAQNVFYTIARTAYRDQQKKARGGDDTAMKWTSLFAEVGEFLLIDVEAVSG